MRTILFAFCLLFSFASVSSLQAQRIVRGPVNTSAKLKVSPQIQGEIKIPRGELRKVRVSDATMINYIKSSLQVYHTNLGARPDGFMPANYFGQAIPDLVSVKAAHTSLHYVYKYSIRGRNSLPIWKPLMVKFSKNNAPYGLGFQVVAHPLIATLTPNDLIFGDYNFNGKLIPIPH